MGKVLQVLHAGPSVLNRKGIVAVLMMLIVVAVL